jgi:hypothetical protein
MMTSQGQDVAEREQRLNALLAQVAQVQENSLNFSGFRRRDAAFFQGIL